MLKDELTKRIGEMLTGMTRMHEDDIAKAYLKTEGTLSLGYTVKIKGDKEGNGIDVAVKFSFVSEKIKDDIESKVVVGQAELFEKKEADDVSVSGS